ncbi:MAG: acetyl-CoA carboxylase carboxyltransferase subunit alpha [Alphaproteobacteria bacterium GM7ARS4]|nr:acetyl-CoA carboxylase carboxyltransferase subunit alpha [Alphaproteobacteria bacterium GM7ARS4]
MRHFLDFEKPLYALEAKIEELRNLDEESHGVNLAEDILKLKEKAHAFLEETYRQLTPWQKVLVARHPQRPHLSDYIDALFSDFVALKGDRYFAEDPAILCGVARFHDKPVCVMGHRKGKDTQTRLHHNFGMAHPEGYRKAVRIMHLADRFHLPIISFIDTPGAYPGVEAEMRGQAEAIAQAINACLHVKTPFISIITGEGGSGGAIALATANAIFMLEHAVYSVITPEACSSILWRNKDHSQTAAQAMKMTAQDLKQLGLIDDIIPEPLGGAHRNYPETIAMIEQTLERSMRQLSSLDRETLHRQKRDKFLAQTRQFVTP